MRLLGMPGARAAVQHAGLPLPGAARILLIRPDHLGDLLLTTPVLHALRTRTPDAHISMMVGPWSSEIVARHPDIDNVITFPFPGFQRAPQKLWTPYILLFNVAQQLRRENGNIFRKRRTDFRWGRRQSCLSLLPSRAGAA